MKHKKFQTYTHDGFTMKNEFRIESDVCIMTLTQGKECMLDVSDIDLVKKHRWYASKYGNAYYAITHAKGTNKSIGMHRLIMNTPIGYITDHKNRLGLLNCRYNLRVVTHSQNMLNVSSKKGYSSKFLGVSWHKNIKKWQAAIRINGKQTLIGYFKNEDDAGLAYALGFVKEHGTELNLDMTKLAQSA